MSIQPLFIIYSLSFRVVSATAFSLKKALEHLFGRFGRVLEIL